MIYVDCTGFRKLLVGKTLNTSVISYKPRLFNDSAVVIRTPVPAHGDIPPFTEARALKCGWAWRIPIGNKISWGYVYSADYSSQEDAEQELRALIGIIVISNTLTACGQVNRRIFVKNIVICADGTWNRPEKKLTKDFPTNVLKIARAIKPTAKGDVTQQVFYDWGIGSYYDPILGGATGKGINKNIMDDYRYIVQNYTPGDALYFFGFSRGAYTVRSLSGLINNCGILKRPDARLIQLAFDHYKNPGKDYSTRGEKSVQFRKAHSHRSREIKFIGVWDTVGALGIPFSFLGLLDRKDEFYDTEIGSNVRIARHAMAIDEIRSDFEPTIWSPKANLDLKQAWFLGVHADIGGSYEPDKNERLISDIPLDWMIRESKAAGLALEPHLEKSLKPDYSATVHKSRRHIYRSKRPHYRKIDHGNGEILIHKSVKDRWDRNTLEYRPKNLKNYFDKNGTKWPTLIT